MLFRGRRKKREAERRRAELFGLLSRDDQERVARLEDRHKEILRLAGENRRLGGAVLERELGKLGELVEAFLEIAAACARWETYLETTKMDDLETEIRKAEADASRAKDAETRELARRNLEVLNARAEQRADLRRKLARGRGELDLMENSFKLIGDQVLAMSSPRELGEKLDEVLVGVAAVREIARGSS